MTANKKQASTSQVLSVVSIPGYQIRNVLGKGGMATVYLAIQMSINREVALKILAPDHTDESFSDRFVREAQIISKLTHPNIVTIYDAGVHAGYNYIAMEYIAGKNLVESHTDLSYRQKIAIIKQIALALDYAGKKGYVHRDIKPENIMLGDDGRAILTDFGIARGHDVESGLTLTGRAVGTPHFMSPEQTKGQRVDHRSDIYSLGVVLFQILTGYVPYDGPSIVAIGIKHISNPVPTLPRFLEQLQPIINKCMAKNPAQRYQTALELHDALASISEAELDFIAAKAKAAAKYHSGVQQTNTLPDTGTVSIPADQRSSHNKDSSRQHRHSASRSAIQAPAKPGTQRRSTWLLLLLLCTVAAFAYYKRADIQPLWLTHIQPLLDKYLATDTTLADTRLPHQATPAPAPDADTQQTKPAQASANNELLQSHAEPGLAEIRLAIRLHRDKLRLNPDDVNTRQALSELHAWYLANIEQSLLARDTDKSRKLLNAYQQDFADTGQQHFASLEKRIIGVEQLLAHLQQARVYMAANAVDKPDGANALEEYLAAQNLAPADEDVRSGLASIARHLYDRAKNARLESRFTEALGHVSTGLRAVPNDIELKQLHEKLLVDIKHQRRHSELVQEADALLKQGHVITPAEQNAYRLYQLVLDQAPHNKAALAGLEQIENWFVGQVQKLSAKQDLLGARDMLRKAQAHFPASARFLALKAEIESAIDATYPKISKVQFSPQAFKSMQTATSLDKLAPGQLLYGGFAYTNFYESGSLVEIRLAEQDGKFVYDKQTFTLNNRQGEAFFDLQLPAQGSASGNYSVEFYLNDVRILKANLSGLH